jgi:hypothetical protein
MSDRAINVEIGGQIRGFQVTLSLGTTKASLNDDIQLLTSLLEEAGVRSSEKEKQIPLTDEPIKRLASELDIEPLGLQHMVGYKEGMVQVTKASQLQVTDAMCMLLYAFEKGYGESGIALEQFESLIKQNGIKLTYPLTTGIFNLKKGGYINAKLYDEEKKLSLSPQGEKNAISAFKDYITGKGVKRTPRAIKKPHKSKKVRGHHK